MLDFLKKVLEPDGKRGKSSKTMKYFIFLLVLTVVLSLAANLLSSGKDDDKLKDKALQSNNTTAQEGLKENSQEMKLKKILSSIKGTGKVEVMITYKSSKEVVPATSTVSSKTETEEMDSNGGVRNIKQTDTNTQPVSINTKEGSEALIIKEIEPEIQGVLVIAEGADDLRVRLELERAVQTVLGLDANQVEVFEME